MNVRRTTRAAFLAAALLVARSGPARGGEVPKDLVEKINGAIDRGAAWLASQWREDGSFPGVVVAGRAQYSIGTTSLCGLALLASGLPPTDPRWEPCLGFLKKLDAGQMGARSTYDTGVLAMFLTSYFGPPPGSKKKPPKGNPCDLPDEAREWIQSLATHLETTQLESGGWRYPAHPPADVSNTQYALLGLRAARDCGATVRGTTFLKAAEWALALQQAEGPKVRRTTPPAKPGEREYVVDAGDRARGWPYKGEGEAVTGSTTTAALAVVVIANDALVRPRHGGYSAEVERRLRRSVQDGFAWLDLHFAVDRNPPIGSHWHHSYLYGLERACMLAGREHVGKHDWYVEGARHLVGSQQEDGHWSTGSLSSDVAASDVVDTAWALLFLKRATKPATPIPAPVVTPGG
jgi:hypothetical protein